MKIDNIKFNDNTIDSLSFNGQEVTKLVMPNGDYWEKESSSEPVFDPRLFMINSEGRGYFDTADSGTNRLLPIYVNGADFFVVHLSECKNVGTITATMGGNGWQRAYIDNYAIYAYRYHGYDSWPAGSGTNQHSASLTITPGISGINSKSFYFGSQIDEAGGGYFRGDIWGRAFRVPAAGIEDYMDYLIYPYNFAASWYIDTIPRMSAIRIGYQSITATEITDVYSDNMLTTSLENGSSAIDIIVRYKISANNTSSYRECAISSILGSMNYYGKGTSCSKLIHFIQEPRNKNRIYYSPHFATLRFDDKYYHASAEDKINYEYHSFFETCNSKILYGADSVILSKNGYAAVCNTSDYEFTSASKSYEVVTDSYMWGDMSYTIIKAVVDKNTFHFDRKSSSI